MKHAGSFNEGQLEEAIINLLVQQGYEAVRGDENHRSFDNVLLDHDIKAFLQRRYTDKNLTDVEIKEIIQRLKLVSSTPLYDGNRNAFQLVCEGFTLTRADTSLPPVYISLIDFDNPSNNSFKVVSQFSVRDKELRRPDLLIFINGIPVVIFELKSAINESTTIYDAWEQITIRYTRDIPRLLRYTFLAVISDGANTRMGSIFTPYEYFYSWNKIDDTEQPRDGISSLLTMIKGAFSKNRLCALLRDFIFYPDESSEEKCPIVCRYPQFFAATKMFANIKAHMHPDGDGKGGTYFGATGCGKTYTMLFLSRLLALRDAERFANPTIIILVDREDLDTQTSKLFVNAKDFLHDRNVRSIDSREDLEQTLKNNPSGGVYITTIQKFSSSMGLLSERENIICISDEAHRTQTGIGLKVRRTDKGVFVTYGLATYLHKAFPKATYCGVTGTPIDETIAVFGQVVDSYTMNQATEDGITVRIVHEPRLARVIVSDVKAKEIQQYYDQAAELGATPEAIEESQKAMSSMRQIIADPDRLKKVAKDIVEHYEAFTAERPNVVLKAMIVCIDRAVALSLMQEIIRLRPEWGEKRKCQNPESLSKEELSELVALPKINLVVTRGANDPVELYETAGSKEHRKMLDKQFKNVNSNFKIAVVVDMWVTGFDVPSLAVMYVDKPLQRHTLIQTISRVNRVYKGKNRGIVVDYIGIRDHMFQALKQYGNVQESPIDEIQLSLDWLRKDLALVHALFTGFNSEKFYQEDPAERLNCLNLATEFIQISKDKQNEFMQLSRRLKIAYEICAPTGELTNKEMQVAQFYLAIRSILYKQTKGNAPDAETMNRVVEEMVKEALACTGVESIMDEDNSLDLSSDEAIEEIDKVKLPITKFNALCRLIKQNIKAYRKTNKVKALEFDERLKAVVADYNTRDRLVFTSGIVGDFINELSSKLIELLKDLDEDRLSFKRLGIDYQAKAFYDILVKVRDEHKFEYDEEKCKTLAQKIKEEVDSKAMCPDWLTRDNIKNQLKRDLILLLYNNEYPPDWNEEIYKQVLEQAKNFDNDSE